MSDSEKYFSNLRTLMALTGDVRYEQLVKEFQGKEEIDMCKLLDKYEEKGREATLMENLKSLMQTMGLTLEKAMDALQVPAGKRSYYVEMMRK